LPLRAALGAAKYEFAVADYRRIRVGHPATIRRNRGSGGGAPDVVGVLRDWLLLGLRADGRGHAHQEGECTCGSHHGLGGWLAEKCCLARGRTGCVLNKGT